MDKIKQEIAELSEALAGQPDADKVAEEVGDLLFAVVNLARHLGTATEEALRHSNKNSPAVFAMSKRLRPKASASKMGQMTLDELETLWRAAKKAESA